MAREVVVGLKTDLIARDDRFWSLIGHAERQSFEHAVRAALEDERARQPLRGAWAWIERALVQIKTPNRER